MILAGEDQSTRRRTCPLPLCPLQIPHGLTWEQTQASVVRGWVPNHLSHGMAQKLSFFNQYVLLLGGMKDSVIIRFRCLSELTALKALKKGK
jgi:hypothetical protein